MHRRRRRPLRDTLPQPLQRQSQSVALESRERPDTVTHDIAGRTNPLHQIVLLNHHSLSGNTRRNLAQQIGQRHGNRFLQRALANAQTQTDPTVRQGSQGAAVQNLQQLLMDRGASITADGIFGPRTREAVIAFQRAAGLAPDGIVGPKTWAQLRGGNAPSLNTAGGNPASQLVLAKLAEINTLMKQIASTPPQSNQIEAPIVGTTEPVEHIAAESHDSEDDESWWDQVTSTASEAWDTVSEGASEAWDTVSEGASNAWDTVSEGASNAWDTVSQGADEVWSTVSEGASEAWDTVSEGAGAAWDTISEGASEAWDAVSQGANDIASEIGSAVDEFVGEIKEQFADEIAAIEEFIGDVKRFLDDPESALRKLDEILNGLKKKADELLGGDSDEQPDVIEGSAEAIVAEAAATNCHDSPSPRKLRFELNYDAQHDLDLSNSSTLNHDAVVATLNFTSVSTTGDAKLAQVPASDFGTTGSKITIGKIDFRAEHFTDFVTASAPFVHEVSYDITDRPGRQDVPPSLEGIDQTNWKEAADDLDPDVHKTSLGAPRRAKFWARDLTVGHEKFHVADNESYVRNTVFPHVQAEFNTKDVDVPWLLWRDTEVAKQLRQIANDLAKQAVDMINKYMAPPGGEQRAYGADESNYRARAKAIRDKAKQEGWDQTP